MEDKHNIGTYSNLSAAASFYLEQSFHFINEALINEYSAYLFSLELDKIDATDEDREIASNTALPQSPVELQQLDIPDVLSQETLTAMSEAWQKSITLSRLGYHKFPKSHQIGSIEILGHLNNFGFFIETLVNRHLLFLKQMNEIDAFSYKRISVAKVMERLIFIFKEELASDSFQLDKIVDLFRLRNKTVHYTPDNANSLSPAISQLIPIWNQSIKMLEWFENKEQFAEEKFSEQLKSNSDFIKKNWT